MDPRALQLLTLRTGKPETELRSVFEGRREWRGAFYTQSRGEGVREQRAASPSDDSEPDAEDIDEPSEGEDPEGELRLAGYSAVFDSDSEILFGFLSERIKRGAFKNVLRDPDLDVRLLVNHDGPAHARTTNGTLTLSEKPRGLFRDAVLDPRRQDSRDLYFSVDREDMRESSFAFTVKRDSWTYCEHVTEDGMSDGPCNCVWYREILEIGELLDDSVVTYPAYPATTATVVRESEPSSERGVLASDEEQREMAGDTDTSLTQSVGDPTHHAMRTRIASLKGSTHVAGNHGGAR